MILEYRAEFSQKPRLFAMVVQNMGDDVFVFPFFKKDVPRGTFIGLVKNIKIAVAP